MEKLDKRLREIVNGSVPLVVPQGRTNVSSEIADSDFVYLRNNFLACVDLTCEEALARINSTQLQDAWKRYYAKKAKNETHEN